MSPAEPLSARKSITVVPLTRPMRAMLYTGNNHELICDFTLPKVGIYDEHGDVIVYRLTDVRSARYYVEPGDWVVKYYDDTILCLDSDQFMTMYEMTGGM